ncbi:MAG: ATP-binding cassette domain-containing protein [Desulfobacterales bacterium]|nr:ATP-binding cassette domain-containing protein [Desulfobacterales bacterium]
MQRSLEPTPLLKAYGIKKYFSVKRGFLQKTVGWIKAVDGVDIKIGKGKILGLVGESGCGKTTLGRLILKLLKPDYGKIFFRGDDLTDLTHKEMKPYRMQMQIIFQDPYGSLNPRMTVGNTIDEGVRLLKKNGRPQRKVRIKELLSMVGLPGNVADRYPHEFSGGQRQRIGIARALSVEPELIVCDEPVSALDVSIQAQIINLLLKLRDELNLTYLFIAHDLNVVHSWNMVRPIPFMMTLCIHIQKSLWPPCPYRSRAQERCSIFPKETFLRHTTRLPDANSRDVVL